jgi:cbb3-type cytochrome oxidase subunit 1
MSRVIAVKRPSGYDSKEYGEEAINMDRFVKGFIVMSIIYLGAATILGVVMLGSENVVALKFVHSHLMMLGWVSMMIFGVGYHILPRFMGRPLYSNRIGEAQFYLANISLVSMVVFYALNVYQTHGTYRMLTMLSGAIQGGAIFMFFYNMLMTMLSASSQK